MGFKRQKSTLTERGMVKNHQFQGVNIAARIFGNVPQSEEWLVYFDPDVDGVVAGYLVCKFLKKHNRKFSWYINSNRAHGWFLSLDSVKGRNIFAVDFIIEDFVLEQLCNKGCRVISMDHHLNGNNLIYNISPTGEGVIINNQYYDEEDSGRYLSGAGVVFESLIQFDPTFDEEINRNLVAITLLSDIRNIENPYAERYLYKLYTAKYVGLIKYLIDSTMGEKDYGFGIPRMDRNYVDFKFSPALNSMFRFNQQDAVVEFFLGMSRLDLGYRESQKELVEEIKNKIKMIEMSSLRVCYFHEQDFSEYADILDNFVGLTASKYLDGEHSVICYLIGKNQKDESLYVKRASFRGRINGLNYNTELTENDLFKCCGHESAFGIRSLVPTKKTFVRANRICSNIEQTSSYRRKIITVTNMSVFVSQNAYEIAEDNMYKLSQNQVRVRYVGNGIQVRRSSKRSIEYLLDGIPVLCFDPQVVIGEGLITPILERGMLSFYLE